MAKKAQIFGNLQQRRKCLCRVTEDITLIYHLSEFSLFIAIKTNKLHLSFHQRIILFTFASDSSNLTGRLGKFSAVELTENARNKTLF